MTNTPATLKNNRWTCKIATRSSKKPGKVYCDKCYWEHCHDGSSVAEQAAARKYEVKRNYN